MTTIPEQLQTLSNKITALRALVNGVRSSGILYAIAGDFCVFGCKVTQGASATDMYLALDGQATGDEANLNPDIVSPPLLHEEYPNIALVYGEVMELANINKTDQSDDSLLLDDAPSTANYGRYDMVYGYVGQSGPAVAILTGTASAAVKTDFVANGLDITAYPSATGFDPTLPDRTFPLARVYVQTGDTGIANARIADLRDFTGRLQGDGAYVYIAYASDASGTGFTTTFDSALNYIAIKATTTEILSPAVGDFTGLWKNYKGATGSQGDKGGLRYAYSSTTTAADPTPGIFRLNNATIGSVTEIYIDGVAEAAADMSAFITSWAAGSTLVISSNTNADASFGVFTINSVVDNTGWFTLGVTFVSGAGFTNLEECVLNYSAKGATGAAGSNGTDGADAYVYIAYASDDTGTDFTNTFDPALNYIAVKATTAPLSPPIVSDFTGLWKNYKGATGATGATGNQGDKGGLRFNFSSDTTAADPTAGIFKFNNATIGSVTEIYIDSLAQASADVSAYVATWAAGGTIIVNSNANADSSFGIFTVTSVVDNTGWFTISVTFVSGAGFTDAEACTLVYLAKGAAGIGTGDVIGPASSVDGEIALFDSTTGKLIKRATTTGLLKAASGVIAAASAGTDYVAPSGALGTPSSGTLTNCTGLPAAGVVGTAAILGANTFTGGQNEARGSVAMHATTMDLWAQPNIIDGTSSAVTVTAIANAPQAGSRRVLYPVANSIITNGATFAVDGAANHTAAAGDKWEFEAITTSTYKVHVTKKDGTAVVGGSSGISNVVTATTSTTLTSTPTLLKFTPTTYGETITLPDATTCPEGGPLHIVDLSDSAYPAKVIDGSGAIVGFIFPGVVSSVSLVDNSTAAGTWAISNVELAGASALLATANILTIESVIEIDSDREFILGKGASDYSYGVVYNRTTNAFGAVTAIRSAATAGKHAAIKSATDRVLVVSCNGTTGFEAVVCSLSGTTITPNTAATATLSANISTFAAGCGLIQVGTSWITSYTVATPAAQIREITISGTTPTISAATVLDGTGGGLIIAGDATHVIAVSTATSHLYTKPYTIGGLSAGTGTDTVSGTQELSNLTALGTRFFVAHYDGAALYGSVISLSGTTTTISTATAFSANGISDAIVVGSGKVLMLSSATTDNANIVTDTAGTASAGTAITLSAQNQRVCVYVSGTDVAVGDGNSLYSVMILSCSGTSPVLSKIIAQTNLDSAEQGKFYGSNKMMNRSPSAVYSGTYARTINDEATTANFGIQINGGTFKKVFPGRLSYEAAVEYRGKNDSERWLADASSQIVKIECAA